jgi:DNA-binding MarR family transcriptional regulator
MQELLIDFINTLDLTLKKLHVEAGADSRLSKLTIHQFQYIDAINELGEPSITEIALRLKITKASVTTGINKLIKLGYVTKTQSDQDKRVFHISLTESSERLVKAKQQALKEYGEFIALALTQEESKQFRATITKLVNLFKQTQSPSARRQDD